MARLFPITITVLLSIAAFHMLKGWFRQIYHAVDEVLAIHFVSYLISYVIICIPVMAGTALIHRKRDVFSPLGLGKNPVMGIVAAVIFTLPMFVGYLAFCSFDRELTLFNLLQATLFAGFFEEVVFRGFLFGQLYRYTRMGFIPATLICALLFAAAHIDIDTGFTAMAGVFAITFLGAAFFAWLYAEWDFNLWVPVFLHTFMNLSWTLFSVSEDATGGWTSNIFRGVTIAAAIAGTILYKRRNGMALVVSRRNLVRQG
jgi:membrane protease YdiL (CAAX protease family)